MIEPVGTLKLNSALKSKKNKYNWGLAPFFQGIKGLKLGTVPFFRQLFTIYDNKASKILRFCLKILGMKVAKDV